MYIGIKYVHVQTLEEYTCTRRHLHHTNIQLYMSICFHVTWAYINTALQSRLDNRERFPCIPVQYKLFDMSTVAWSHMITNFRHPSSQLKIQVCLRGHERVHTNKQDASERVCEHDHDISCGRPYNQPLIKIPYFYDICISHDERMRYHTTTRIHLYSISSTKCSYMQVIVAGHEEKNTIKKKHKIERGRHDNHATFRDVKIMIYINY